MNRLTKVGEKLLCIPNNHHHSMYDPTVGTVYTCASIAASAAFVIVTGPPPLNFPSKCKQSYIADCFISLPDEIDLRENK